MVKKDKNLYVIESGEFSDFDYYGIFDTKQEAENMILFIVNRIHKKDNLDEEIETKDYPIFESYGDYVAWKRKEKSKSTQQFPLNSEDWVYIHDFWIVKVPLNKIKDKELEHTLKLDTDITGDFHKLYRKWKLNQFQKREKGHNNENL